MGGWCSCLDDDQEGKSVPASSVTPVSEGKTQVKTSVAQLQQQQQQHQQPQQPPPPQQIKGKAGHQASTTIETVKSIGKVASTGGESKLSHGGGGVAGSNTGNSLINTVPTTTKYTFNLQLANGLDQAKDSDEVWKRLSVANGGPGHGGRLARDQKLKKTSVGGFEVNPGTTRALMSRKEVERQRHTPDLRPDISLILEERFSSLHLIVPGVYLTSTFGLQSEAFAEAKVWVLINATYELPAMRRPELLCVRVPVEDDAASRIDAYFDDVADLIETARRRGRGSVVHCVAGVSRSTTLVLAYLLKYTSLSLHQAFVHTKTVRPVVRPNVGFLQQLMDYEAKVKPGGVRSAAMVTTLDRRRKVTVTVPDFYKKEFPDLYEWEVNKQLAKNAASGGGGGDGKKQ